MRQQAGVVVVCAALLGAAAGGQASPPGKASQPPSGVSSSTAKRRPRLRVRAEEPAPVEAATHPADAAEDGVDEPVSIASLTAEDHAASDRITQAVRSAVHITAADIDLHLNTHTAEAEARIVLTARNDGASPIAVLPLRVSGALHWESARLAVGSTLAWEEHRVADDLDHTGVATEIALMLPEPLAAGASVKLDLFYAGSLASSTARLHAMGAPESRAATVDWDTVTDTFTGLRGVGNMLWTPTAGATGSLSDGDAFAAAVTAARESNARSLHLRLTAAYSGSKPVNAYLAGEPKPLQRLDAEASADAEQGAAVAEWTIADAVSRPVSLFLVSLAPTAGRDDLLRVVSDNTAAASAVRDAAERVQPMLGEWLGARPARPLEVIDLPIPDGAAFADGNLLVMPLRAEAPAAFAPLLVRSMAAAWMPGDVAAPWLRDGLPEFLHAVFLERTRGRETALRDLHASDAAVRAAAPAALRDCAVSVCARLKSASVLWMLRSLAGDAALQQSLSALPRGVSATEETVQFEALLTRTSGKNLQWFFKDWIDEAHALPELTIVTVAPRRTERAERGAPVEKPRPVAGPIGAEPVPLPGDPEYVRPATPSGSSAPPPGSWLVAVEVQNNGDSAAQVPVTVQAGSLTNTLSLRVPAHGRGTIRVPFEAEPQAVTVNDGSVPEQRVSTHRRSIAP